MPLDQDPLTYVADVYRIAFFLSGSSSRAEVLAQTAYLRTWRERSTGQWRLALARNLVEEAAGNWQEHACESRPPLWQELSALEYRLRSLILLEALDFSEQEIAWITRTSESRVSIELQTARAAFAARMP